MINIKQELHAFEKDKTRLVMQLLIYRRPLDTGKDIVKTTACKIESMITNPTINKQIWN